MEWHHLKCLCLTKERKSKNVVVWLLWLLKPHKNVVEFVIKVISSFVLYLLPIVLSVFLRYTDSDYPFGICKLFYIEKLNLTYSRHELDWLIYWLRLSWQLRLKSLARPEYQRSPSLVDVFSCCSSSIFCIFSCLFFFDIRILITPFGIFNLFYIISFWKIKHPYGGATGILIQKIGNVQLES
jgi:hypothetical protein